MRNKVTQKRINNILNHSTIEVKTVYDKVTVVSCKLPNGFVITESSGAVDPANYDEAIGRDICMQRIESRLWELEGYILAVELNKRESSLNEQNTILDNYTKALDLEISGEDSISRKAFIDKLVNKGIISPNERDISEGYYKGLRVAREMLDNMKSDVPL